MGIGVTTWETASFRNGKRAEWADAVGTETANAVVYRQILKDHMDQLYEKIKNGDTEQKFQIGAQSLSLREWDELLEKFDEVEEEIRELVEEEVEAKKEAKQEEDNAFYTITRGEHNSIKVYDKATGRTYTFLEEYLSIQTDKGTGCQYLISDIPHTTMNVEAMLLTPELRMSIEQFRNGEAIKEKALDSKFTVYTDPVTGIQSLHWRSGDGEAYTMLMSTAEQKEKYEALANTYLATYPNLVSSQWEAELRAAQEVFGNARRVPGGIISVSGNAVSYDDNNDSSKSWVYFLNVRMSDEEYMYMINHIKEYIRSADAGVFVSEMDFLKGYEEHLKQVNDSIEKQMQMLTSESAIAETTSETGKKELHIMWTNAEGVFCRKAGQTSGYEWSILFSLPDQRRPVEEYMHSLDKDDMPYGVSTRKFWEDFLGNL